MAIIIDVTNPLTPAIATSIGANVTAAHALINPLAIALTGAETKAMLPVSTNRTGETAAIYTNLLIGFPQTLPVGLTLAEFQAMTQEELDTASQMANYITLAGELESHLKIIRNNRFVYMMQVLDNATLLGKNNPTMATAEKAIRAEFFGKKTSTDEVTYTVGIAASVTVAGVKTDKMLTNTGHTIISVLNVNGNVADTLTIHPGSGKIIPIGWSNIVVTNMSATEEGAFSLYKKA